MIQRTLSIIKPDAITRNLSGKIIAKLEQAGLRIIAQRRIWLSLKQAQSFYHMHKEKPFFESLCKFMISAPVIVQILEAENAIELNRKIMGATNPKEALAGTIRYEFALNTEANSVHGSDSEESAAQEIAFFFAKCDIL